MEESINKLNKEINEFEDNKTILTDEEKQKIEQYKNKIEIIDKSIDNLQNIKKLLKNTEITNLLNKQIKNEISRELLVLIMHWLVKITKCNKKIHFRTDVGKKSFNVFICKCFYSDYLTKKYNTIYHIDQDLFNKYQIYFTDVYDKIIFDNDNIYKYKNIIDFCIRNKIFV